MFDDDHISLELDVDGDGYFDLVTALETRADRAEAEDNEPVAESCRAIAEQARQQVMHLVGPPNDGHIDPGRTSEEAEAVRERFETRSLRGDPYDV